MPAFLAVAGGVAMLGGVAAVFLGLNEPMRQDVNYFLFEKRPNTKLGPSDTAAAIRRGALRKDEGLHDMRVLGYDDHRQEAIQRVTEQLLTGYEYITAWRRGEYDSGTIEYIDPDWYTDIGVVNEHSLKVLYSHLYQTGMSSDAAKSLITISEFVPTAQDIIAFAVREVYSPEIAEAFGQFEGVEDILKLARSDIRATGMSDTTFGKYWAAHWQLPGLSQGYEMFHRTTRTPNSLSGDPIWVDEQGPVYQVIGPESLRKLLVALDIMPAYREPLTEIAYAPYTRVDVRRMHQVGTLTSEEVYYAYLDYGFSPDKAAKMTDFTIKYNEAGLEYNETYGERQANAEKDLTQTDILGAYEDMILSREETLFALQWIGYSEDEANLKISRKEAAKEREEVNNILEVYKKAYVGRIMEHGEVVDKLNALDLAANRSTKLIELWDIERAARVTRPTKSEILSFFKTGIIDKDTAIEELKGAGYKDQYINWYLEKVEGELTTV